MSATYLLVSSAQTLEAFAALTLVLVAANAAVLWRCLPAGDLSGPREFTPVMSRRNRQVLSTLGRYLVCIAVIGYGSGAAQPFVFPGSQARLLDMLSAAAMPLSAAALIVVWEVMRREFRLRSAFLAILLVEVACFALLPVVGSGFALAFAAVCFFTFSVASMLMVEGCVETARARGIDASGVFGVFVAIVYTFLIAGLSVNAKILMESDFSNTLVVTVGVVYLVVAACLALGVGGRGRDREDDAEPGEAGTGGTGAGGVRRPDGAGPGGQVATPGWADSPAAGVGQAPLASDPSGQSFGVGGRRPGVDLALSAPLGETERRREESLSELCESLGETYLLSERERDVLELLIRGNSVAKMADVLFLSQNTVKSHCRSLYRKMGVHSRQQIVDMLDGWEGPAR